MAAFIWSLSKLEELLDHSHTSVGKWAVVKLFYLYPTEFQRRLPRLLQDNRPQIVQTSLDFVGRESSEELLPLLKDLYLSGSEKISAKAIHVVGEWRCAEAVQWMRERILAEQPLGKEQVAAMIYALGRISEGEAYTLLKLTETAVAGKESAHWDLFYASLLEHQRTEDVESLLRVILDEERKEETRRDALGLLLAQVDPRLNPSDVFFTNHPAVDRHILKRLTAIEEAAGAESKKTIESIRRAVALLEGDSSHLVDVLYGMETTTAAGCESCRFTKEIFDLALATLRETPGASKWQYGLVCLALSAAIRIVEEGTFPEPKSESQWQDKLDYLLRDRPPQATDQALTAEVVHQADRQELISSLSECIENHPESWGALRALEMLGLLKAVEAADSIVGMLGVLKDELSVEAAQSALLRVGLAATPWLIARLDSAHLAEKLIILDVLAQLPTEEGIGSIVPRFPVLYIESPERSLKAAYETGSKEFLPFLENEYRRGEWDIGRVYLHLCRVNEVTPDRFAEIEHDVQRGDAFAEESKRLWSGEQAHWPTAIQLELACKNCGKRYHYELHEIHQHPKKSEKEEQAGQDFTPYKHGLVIVDDIRCKNCHTLNQFELTARSFAQITTESVKVLAFQRMNMQPPSYYPFKHVKVDEKDGSPVTLADVEQEHLDAVRLHPTRPAAQLALGKFYEYVKDYQSARRAYLQAVDLDARALEAMAGLARLDHAEERLQEALDWIESCYEGLDKGNFYLTEDRSMFKKMVRQKRREFSRELGIKPEDKPVEIRFRLEQAEYPKNKPCPCGSGKKYKLCCMK